MTLEKLQEEISKCTILCGNCHAIFHWRETHESDE
jgi:predicted HNH restriction endonuclease